MSERITTWMIEDGCTTCSGTGRRMVDDPAVDPEEWDGDADDIPQVEVDCEYCKGTGKIEGNGPLHFIRREYVP